MKFILSVSAFLVPFITLACNSCGCFIGSGISGLNLQNDKYMLRYSTQYRNFHTIHPSDDVLVLERQTKEQFWSHSAELTRQIKPWLLASVGLNGARNVFTEGQEQSVFSGLSSINFGLGYQQLWKSFDNGNNMYWLARASYAFPLGEHKGNAANNTYSEAMYASTGANAGSGAMQLLYNRKKALYYGQANVTINGRSPEDYRFGTAVNLALGMAMDVHSFKNNKTLVCGLETALYHSYANQYRGKDLPDNNGTYSVIMPQLGYKAKKTSVLFRKALVLGQDIGSGHTQLKNQVEVNLTIKI